jgi:hypothetical protein
VEGELLFCFQNLKNVVSTFSYYKRSNDNKIILNVDIFWEVGSVQSVCETRFWRNP